MALAPYTFWWSCWYSSCHLWYYLPQHYGTWLCCQDCLYFFQLPVHWESIRPKKQTVSWHKIIWFPLHVPKYSFIAWLAILDRLPTLQRLSTWVNSTITNTNCFICGFTPESRDHLFFSCPFFQQVWATILQISDTHHGVGGWNSELQWATNSLKSKSLKSILSGKKGIRENFGRSSCSATSVVACIKEAAQLRICNSPQSAISLMNYGFCR